MICPTCEKRFVHERCFNCNPITPLGDGQKPADFIHMAKDAISRAQDGLDENECYAANQLTRAIEYLVRARAALVPDVAPLAEGGDA